VLNDHTRAGFPAGLADYDIISHHVCFHVCELFDAAPVSVSRGGIKLCSEFLTRTHQDTAEQWGHHNDEYKVLNHDETMITLVQASLLVLLTMTSLITTMLSSWPTSCPRPA
jgi:hypothetical protein